MSGFFLLLGGLIVSAVWPIPQLVFLLFIFAGMLNWVLAFYLDKAFLAEDIPFLFLLLGTIIFSRAFSIMGINLRGAPLFVTEIVLALSIILWMFRPKRFLVIWEAVLKADLFIAFVVYLLFGTIHLLLGFISNGHFALRDIVFCHYGLLFFIVLHVLSDCGKIKSLSQFFILGMTAVLLVGCLMHFIPRASHLPLYQFIKETKQFNWGFIFGLIAIVGLCFIAFKKKKRWILGVMIYLSLLFVLLTLVRSAWLGLVAAIVFMGYVLKKEIVILAVLVPLIVGSVFLLDLLPYNGDVSARIWEEMEGTLPGEERTNPRINLEWRLSVWEQTLQQISEKPVFGWGFGHFPEYILRGKAVPQPVGVGPDSGILPPHNHLLAIVYKTGILGLIIFLYINGRIFLYGFRYLKKCHSEFLRRLLTASLVGLVYWHAIAFFFDMLESPPTGIYLWILLGMVICIVNADLRHGDQFKHDEL